jgi:diguanylate cyclase (GGDEF)-like protein
VLFVDVDCFGKYNHRYGDSAGDEGLRTIARTLMRASRTSSDLVFRKGGEEFIVVVPEVDLSSAVTVAERIRSAVEALQIPHADSNASTVVTVTIGVDCACSGERLAEARDRAGALAMDAKKSDQRNRVHSRRDLQ